MFGQQKTPFGGTTGFGTTTKPFGAAKTAGTGAFGTSSFGATQTPATGGLFGGTATNTGTGLFGGTSFGTPSTSTSTFGGFGTSTTQTGGGLFGTSTSTAGTGLFATPQQQTAPFGAANKTGFGGFGTQTSTAATGTGLFGATQQTPSLFGGGQTTSTGLFGAVGGIAAGTNGTTVKFNPVSGSDTMMKNGVSQNIRTAHQCITAMKEYETKSLEELRVEDYLANRKGGSTGTTAMFGATATPQTGGGLFGNTATTTSTTGFTFGKAAFGTGATGFGTTSTGTGLFGQTQTTQAGGLFASPFGGTATTTTASTGFSFGQTNTGTGLFGQTQQKTGLFGQPTTQTTGLFGTPSTTTTTGFGTTFGTGTFGTQNQAGGLFGANKAPTFGATTTTSTAGGLFGNTATNTGGLFGQNKPGLTLGLGTGFGTGAFGTTTTSTGTSLFGPKPTNTFGAGLGTGLGAGLGTLGTGSIFGNTGLGAGIGTGTTGLNLTQPAAALGTDAAAQLAQQAQIQQQLQALSNSPFGDSPLFRNNVADPAKRAELLKPTSLAAQKALTTPSHYKISPRPTAKIKPKPLHSLVAGKSQLFEGLDDEDTSLSNDTFVPRRSVKKLIIRNKASPTASELDAGLGEEDDLLAPPAYPSDTFLVEDKRTSESEKENDPMENLYSNPVRKPIPDTPANKSSPAPDDSIIALNVRQRSCSPGQDSMGEPTNDQGEGEEEVEREPHPAGIVLTKNEYYTEPTLDELANMVDENGDCWVENFVIGREGYGSVFFPGLTNVANLNLDETVHIRRKEITVYPDDSTKPPEGDGLNKKAEVTLHCTWPMDKTAHIPIKSPDRLKKMGYQEKIEVATSKIGARFLEYRPDTGSWVFQVPHFSKYGLDDSEDEEELVGQDQKKMKMQQQADLQKQQLQKENQPPSLNKQQPITERVKSEQPIMEQMQDDSDMADISQEPIPDLAPNSSGDQDGLEGLSEEEVVPSSHRLATHLGMSAHRMQVMKASFFGDEEEGEGMDYKPVFGGMSGRSSLRGSAPPSGAASPLPHRMAEARMDRGSFLAHTARLGSLGSPVRGLGGMSPSHSPRTRIPSGGFSPKYSPKVEQSGLFPSLSKPAPYPVFERNQGLLLPSGLSSEIERPRKIVGSQRQPMLLPWRETVTNEKQSLVADAALMMGRSFKVGWGPNWTLVRCAGADREGEAQERKKETSIPFSILPKSTPRLAKLGTSSPFSVVMERVDVAPHFVVQDKVTVANHVSHLEVELETSLCSTEDHPCPVFVPTPGVNALHQHAEVAGRNRENTGVRHPERESADHASLVLSLCVALWGDLPDQDREDGEDGLDRTSYAYHMARREAVSHWLMNQAQDTIEQEVQDSKFKEGGHTDAIFSLLSGRQISQACSLAQQSGDHRLALLLAQASGSHFPRELVGKQLSDWEELKADRFISDSRLRVYALLAGKPVWPATNGEINTCENLDWKRALAVHLWYLCTPSATVSEALHLYCKAFTKNNSDYGEYANPPLPPYLERSADRSGDQEDRYVIRDMCYHLLQLYADRSHQLDRLLAPTTSTPNQLDYRLSWLVCQVLQALDYTHLSEHHLNTIHAGYIAQLESLGLWEWAVFVALHITDNSRRELVTKELLCRHCSLSEEEAYVLKEEFLQEKLRVPVVWIHEAKALRAQYEGKSHNEAWHLLKAGKWNASHRIILKHLAADAIINEDYEYLKEFLEELSPPDRSSTIQDWNFGGRVFLDYILINNALVEMAKGNSSSYDLERLHPQVTSLCSRIENIPCLTPKDRLCQSEMAKKAASFLRLVLEGQNKPPTLDGEYLVPSYQLAPHITKLPMPEDYALQELRALTHSYMMELTT